MFSGAAPREHRRHALPDSTLIIDLVLGPEEQIADVSGDDALKRGCITIPISHYCEKARWALDRAGVAYVEERHVQGISVFARGARAAGDDRRCSSPTTGCSASRRTSSRWADGTCRPSARLFPTTGGARGARAGRGSTTASARTAGG